MSSNVFLDSSNLLARYAEQHSHVLVGYSGGKDSLAVLDLCVKAFKKVTCYHRYFVPGLKVVEDQLDWARQHYGVEIKMYPSFALFACLRDGVWRPQSIEFSSLPDIGPFDIADLALSEIEATLCATGMRKGDSPARRRMLKNIAHRENIIHPIQEWNKLEVLAYCKLNKLPLPDSDGSSTSGVGSTARQILWLADKHPEDYAKYVKWFPYSRAAIARRDLYGIGSYRSEKKVRLLAGAGPRPSGKKNYDDGGA